MNVTCYHCLKINFLNTNFNLYCKCKFCKNTLLSKSVIHGTKENLEKFLEDDLLTIIKFWAPWCGPCRNFSPIFEDISKKYREKIRFVKVNIETECILSKEFNIKKVPTIILCKEERKKIEFTLDLSKKSFSQWIENNLV